MPEVALRAAAPLGAVALALVTIMLDADLVAAAVACAEIVMSIDAEMQGVIAEAGLWGVNL